MRQVETRETFQGMRWDSASSGIWARKGYGSDVSASNARLKPTSRMVRKLGRAIETTKNGACGGVARMCAGPNSERMFCQNRPVWFSGCSRPVSRIVENFGERWRDGVWMRRWRSSRLLIGPAWQTSAYAGGSGVFFLALGAWYFVSSAPAVRPRLGSHSRG